MRIAFTGAHLGIITATTWMLMLNGVVGYQVLNDGSFMSILLLFGSAAALLVGTGYIALDTGYNWTGYFNTAQIQQNPNRSYALYTLYLLAPLVFLFIYGCLETYLVLKILGEIKPMRKFVVNLLVKTFRLTFMQYSFFLLLSSLRLVKYSISLSVYTYATEWVARSMDHSSRRYSLFSP